MNPLLAPVSGKNFRLGRVACPAWSSELSTGGAGASHSSQPEIFLTLLPGQTDQRIRLPTRGHALKDQDARTT
jgi:hypothetical protein